MVSHNSSTMISTGSCMQHNRTMILVLLLTIGLCTAAGATEPFRPLRTVTPPIIDGKLDDPVWQKAPSVTGFRTCEPDYGKAMLGETRVFMAYDSENLYFAFRCDDSAPDRIKANMTARDNNLTDDWVCINLDSFFDHQSGYGLYVNPLGVQTDTRFTAAGEDAGYDLVWYSAGRLEGHGYTVEVQIPIQSIRFSGGDTVTMGVIFERAISRRSEQGTYPPLDPALGGSYASWLAQMHPMAFTGLKQKPIIEILPAVTYSHKYDIDQGELRTSDNSVELGLTGKYGIMPDLVLDATYKPDFSQVESDAGQVDVNLRHALVYPEKRPFFQEGSESFKVAATASSELDPVQSIVNTRTIMSPFAGAKLTGKIGRENTIASIYAADQLPEESSVAGGRYNHFVALRYKRAVGQDSYLGCMYTGFEQTGHYNRLAIIDGQVRLTPSGVFEYDGMMSGTKADCATQAATGHSVSLRYSSVTRDMDYDVSFRDIAENFNAEMGTGYVNRTGLTLGTGLLRPKFYPSSEVLRRIDLEMFTGQTKDRRFDMWETFNHIAVTNYLWGTMGLKVKYSYSTEIYNGERFRTGGFHILCQGQWTKEFYAGVLYRRRKAILYATNPIQGTSNIISADATYQPDEKLNSEFTFTFSDFSRDSDGSMLYNYPISRFKLTYQLNRYFFLRGVVEYNNYRRQLLTDFLGSFTLIPGTVMYAGYGSLYEKIAWENDDYVSSDRFLETARGLFLKASYLWRV